ncbi:MAG: DNA polymerase III subunit gamma/tau [Alphaproteobacteria bacterium]|nr:DNA polymerase III subunit gamma/tau [Alphaproteobacteria bacterium]
MSEEILKKSKSDNEPYRVLARKYRPQNFDELIGQDALVRTLKNAIESGRIAHAFMLTGVRGVGKTTTARIIAKALNYVGADKSDVAISGSTEDCQICTAISEDRHPDVIEMDAASRTGVDDIREILDGVRYAPTEARYKIYIIDEVHMLSKNAFNALLKTLEEPPEHVKFIFATTEIRKVPITVLSRCQRFDLRRVDIPTLSAHYMKICKSEGVKVEKDAIVLIARAADGSVRDGLSLLDQAMALGGQAITTVQIHEMLGLADRARGLDLLEHALSGNMPEALKIMEELYRAGADTLQLMQDLLDLTHILTKLRAVPEAKEMKNAMSADSIARASEFAGKLSMPTLGKTWQLLLKGLGEVQIAPNPQTAAEMVVIRLSYAANLPNPVDLIRKLENKNKSVSESTKTSLTSSVISKENTSVNVGIEATNNGGSSSSCVNTAVSIAQQSDIKNEIIIHSLQDIITELEQAKAFVLAGQVFQYVHLVKLESLESGGRLEFRPEEQASKRLAQDLGKQLQILTGKRWMVSISSATGEPTLSEQKKAAHDAEYNKVFYLPVIQDILKVFPDAKLTDITTVEKQ